MHRDDPGVGSAAGEAEVNGQVGLEEGGIADKGPTRGLDEGVTAAENPGRAECGKPCLQQFEPVLASGEAGSKKMAEAVLGILQAGAAAGQGETRVEAAEAGDVGFEKAGAFGEAGAVEVSKTEVQVVQALRPSGEAAVEQGFDALGADTLQTAALAKERKVASLAQAAGRGF